MARGLLTASLLPPLSARCTQGRCDTARARSHRRRAISVLALVVSLPIAALTGPGTAAASPGLAPSRTSQTQTDTDPSGAAGRMFVRVGALIFAIGGIASYVAAGSRRRPDCRRAPLSTPGEETDEAPVSSTRSGPAG